MAELLAGVVLTAAQSVLAGRSEANGTALRAALIEAAEPDGPAAAATPLPPPMIPGNAENPTTLCAMQVRGAARLAPLLQI